MSESLVPDPPGCVRGEFIELLVGDQWVKVKAGWRSYPAGVHVYEEVKQRARSQAEQFIRQYTRQAKRERYTGFPETKRQYRED